MMGSKAPLVCCGAEPWCLPSRNKQLTPGWAALPLREAVRAPRKPCQQNPRLSSHCHMPLQPRRSDNEGRMSPLAHLPCQRGGPGRTIRPRLYLISCSAIVKAEVSVRRMLEKGGRKWGYLGRGSQGLEKGR